MVVVSPLLGGPKATKSGRRVLMHLATLAAVLVTAIWMLAQYAMQVEGPDLLLDFQVPHLVESDASPNPCISHQ